MSRFRLALGVFSLFAAFAANSAIASADSNAFFEVNDTAVTTAVPIAPATTTVTNWKLVGANVTVVCTTLEVVGGNLEAAGKNSATSLKFKNCTVNNNTKCLVKGGEVKTAPVVSQAEWDPLEEDTEEGGEIKFEPASPPTFVTIEFVKNGTETCGLTLVKLKVEGFVACKAKEADKEQATHTLECPATTGSPNSDFGLKVNEEAATFEGAGTVKLTSGSNFSLGWSGS